ncbi:MAG: alpha/beta hydrolase [Flavisolibacter sp.]
MRRPSKRKIFRIVWFSLVFIFLVYNWNSFQAHDLPPETFQSGEKVKVTEDEDQILFQSMQAASLLEIIFFQGGLTDPDAYAPLCRKIAENGFTCHLVKMNWRMPVWDYKKVYRLFNLASGNYIIGGHSQGGKMAAQVVYESAGKFKGLFLLGTSHPRDIDLSSRNIPTIKLYAEQDGLASVEEVMENKNKLPAGGKLTFIRGGNHSQFGYLGHLLLDGPATLSLEEQQKQTLEHLLNFFRSIKK